MKTLTLFLLTVSVANAATPGGLNPPVYYSQSQEQTVNVVVNDTQANQINQTKAISMANIDLPPCSHKLREHKHDCIQFGVGSLGGEFSGKIGFQGDFTDITMYQISIGQPHNGDSDDTSFSMGGSINW